MSPLCVSFSRYPFLPPYCSPSLSLSLCFYVSLCLFVGVAQVKWSIPKWMRSKFPPNKQSSAAATAGLTQDAAVNGRDDSLPVIPASPAFCLILPLPSSPLWLRLLLRFIVRFIIHLPFCFWLSAAFRCCCYYFWDWHLISARRALLSHCPARHPNPYSTPQSLFVGYN